MVVHRPAFHIKLLRSHINQMIYLHLYDSAFQVIDTQDYHKKKSYFIHPRYLKKNNTPTLSLASPKSANFICPSAEIRIFSGFRSL